MQEIKKFLGVSAGRFRRPPSGPILPDGTRGSRVALTVELSTFVAALSGFTIENLPPEDNKTGSQIKFGLTFEIKS